MYKLFSLPVAALLAEGPAEVVLSVLFRLVGLEEESELLLTARNSPEAAFLFLALLLDRALPVDIAADNGVLFLSGTW